MKAEAEVTHIACEQKMIIHVYVCDIGYNYTLNLNAFQSIITILDVIRINAH